MLIIYPLSNIVHYIYDLTNRNMIGHSG